MDLRGTTHARRHLAAHGGDAFLPWGVDQNIPALLYPTFQPGEHVKLIIVQLNRSVLEKEVFSELSRNIFAAPADRNTTSK